MSPEVSRRLLLIALLAGIVATGCAGGAQGGATAGEMAARQAAETFAAAHGLEGLARADVRVGGPATSDAGAALHVVALVADTPATRSRGLMGVETVPQGVGMLFVFPDPPGPEGRPGFWMLDTLAPLDIAFAADGVVVGVATMLPCPGPPCPITHPGVDYDVALELAAGVLDAAGIAVGDRFVWQAAVAAD
jgi:uncharacterized membrane protein (UPF0127 family)